MSLKNNYADLLKDIIQKKIYFIVVTGGVCSSIGKGVLVSSLGVLLKQAGFSLSLIKWDPYLNVDPGTMSPLVHGEVFVTHDGAETDLDLGHYERFLSIELDRSSSVTSGKIFEEVLNKERRGEFLGKCIQLVPHVVDATKRRLLAHALEKNVSYVLLEIGGTVGDMEGNVFLEAIRQLRMEIGQHRFLHAHLSFVPVLEWTGEIKTKPTQHSVIQLKQAGLIPDFLFLRSDKIIDEQSVDKLSIMCGVKREYIFHVPTARPIYKLFLDLNEQGLGSALQEYFNHKQIKEIDLAPWKDLLQRISQAKQIIKIGLIAKYVGSNDPYISVVEALKTAGYYTGAQVVITVIDAQQLEKSAERLEEALKDLDGIVVPGGFDVRGAQGKINAARYAREHKIPYFGLCLGLQIMLIEFARSVLGLTSANSLEMDAQTPDPVITPLSTQLNLTQKGATMRLGSYPCTLIPYSRAYAAYEKDMVTERHRHRYEFNNTYKELFEAQGMLFSGIYKEGNLIEIAEINDHPFMLGTQYHPEFTSRPLQVHPLFKAFLDACLARKK